MEYYFYNTDANAILEQPRPRYPVLLQQGFAAVGGDRHQYGEQLEKLSANDILLMYENGVGVVAIGRVVREWDRISYTVSRYYSLSELNGLTGSPYEYRIEVDWFADLSLSPLAIDFLRDQSIYPPRGTVKRIVKRRAEIEQIIEESREKVALLPGELYETSKYQEGALKRVFVNAFERSRQAVIECKRTHGTNCSICGLDFGKIYGHEFAGFIHVHHLHPLSDIGEEYLIDPVEDLRPVCPNCHSVIHYGGRTRSLEEVQALLKNQQTLD